MYRVKRMRTHDSRFTIQCFNRRSTKIKNTVAARRGVTTFTKYNNNNNKVADKIKAGTVHYVRSNVITEIDKNNNLVSDLGAAAACRTGNTLYSPVPRELSGAHVAIPRLVLTA